MEDNFSKAYVKEICETCGITQAELARRMGVSPQNLNNKLRRDSLHISDLVQIADAIDCVIDISISYSREGNISLGGYAE